MYFKFHNWCFESSKSVLKIIALKVWVSYMAKMSGFVLNSSSETCEGVFAVCYSIYFSFHTSLKRNVIHNTNIYQFEYITLVHKKKISSHKIVTTLAYLLHNGDARWTIITLYSSDVYVRLQQALTRCCYWKPFLIINNSLHKNKFLSCAKTAYHFCKVVMNGMQKDNTESTLQEFGHETRYIFSIVKTNRFLLMQT